jgi:hypothetical protein
MKLVVKVLSCLLVVSYGISHAMETMELNCTHVKKQNNSVLEIHNDAIHVLEGLEKFGKIKVFYDCGKRCFFVEQNKVKHTVQNCWLSKRMQEITGDKVEGLFNKGNGSIFVKKFSDGGFVLREQIHGNGGFIFLAPLVLLKGIFIGLGLAAAAAPAPVAVGFSTTAVVAIGSGAAAGGAALTAGGIAFYNRNRRHKTTTTSTTRA